MTRWEFRLPDIGEGVSEGEIVGWLVKPGDAVREDQPIVEVMTDKATVTITAPRSGTVVETRGVIGETVPVHTVLVVFEIEGSPPATLPRANGHNGGSGTGGGGSASAGESPAALAVGEIKEILPGMTSPEVRGPRASEAPGAALLPAMAPSAYFNEKPLATPATRKLARDMDIDLRHVPPSGPLGRVTKRDVESFARPSPRHEHHGRPEPRRPEPDGDPVHALHAPLAPAESREERVPFAGLRRKIAQKMALSKSTAAHFTFVEECDVTDLKALRERLKAPAAARGVTLSFLPFIVKAVVASLKKHPMLNATLDEATNELVLKKYYHIGIATATPAGLLVPVVREADRLSLLDLAREIERLASEARASKAKVEDLQGSTFTITSLGAQGGLLATPIINFPEVAILGVHQMKAKPVVKNGQIMIGDVMLLSVSFDHRVVDGHVGAAFAYEVIGYLQHPEAMLLDLV